VTRERTVDQLDVRVYNDLLALARAAALDAGAALRAAIAERGDANVMLATGNSQLVFLAELVTYADVDWSRVTAFHMDEYVGLPPTHSASFQRYMRERVAANLPFTEFHYLRGDTGDAEAEARRYTDLLGTHPLDLCCCGIGENGHLAFNDPPADFETEEPYLVVRLDEACRLQQMGEGWFPRLEDVPAEAVSMSVRQILKSREILCIVPDQRKAVAVAACLEGPVTPLHPASILQQHAHTTVYLDGAAASLLAARPALP